MNCCLEAFDFKYEGGQHAPPTEDIHVEQSDSIHEAAENPSRNYLESGGKIS